MELCICHTVFEAFVVPQGRCRLPALVGTLCWKKGTWASHPLLTRSFQGQDLTLLFPELLTVLCSYSLLPFCICPSQTSSVPSSHRECSISAEGTEWPSQQGDHTVLLVVLHTHGRECNSIATWSSSSQQNALTTGLGGSVSGHIAGDVFRKELPMILCWSIFWYAYMRAHGILWGLRKRKKSRLGSQMVLGVS